MKDAQGSSPVDRVRQPKAHIMVPSLVLPAKEPKAEKVDKSKSPQSDESQLASLPNSARSMTDSSGIPSARSAMSMNSARGPLDASTAAGAGARSSQSARRPGDSPKHLAATKSVSTEKPPLDAEHWRARCLRLQKQLEESSDIRVARLESENKLLREKMKQMQEVADYMRMRDRMRRERIVEAEERNKDLQLQLAKTERLIRELRTQAPVPKLGRVPPSSATPREVSSPIRPDHHLTSARTTPRQGSTPRELLSPTRAPGAAPAITPRSIGSTPRDFSSGTITPAGVASGRAHASPRDAANVIEDLQRANAELRRRLSANLHSAKPVKPVSRDRVTRPPPPPPRTPVLRGRTASAHVEEDADVELTHADGGLDSDRARAGEGCSLCRGQRRVSFNEQEAAPRGKEDEGYLSDGATLTDLREVLKGIQTFVAARRRQKPRRRPDAVASPPIREPFEPTNGTPTSRTLITLTGPEDTHLNLAALD